MRVLVTGVGIVSPLAAGALPTFRALASGVRAIGELTLFDTTGQRSRLAAEVKGLRVSDVAPAGEHQRWSRTDAMALLAAREALGHARIAPGRGGDPAIDLIVGGTTGGMFETEELLAEMNREGSRVDAAGRATGLGAAAPHEPRRDEPMARMLTHPLSATADRLQAAIGPFRAASSLCSACSGGANAILLGATRIRRGAAHRVLAGGADGLCRLTFTGFNALAAVDAEPCRPFDRHRAGLSLGEGAAFLVLESEESVRERHAEPLAELAGWAVGCEAHHITHPEPSGKTAAHVIALAMSRAGIPPGVLDYVNAHGTGTPLNDEMESNALTLALGEDVRRVPVSSTKGQIGHTLGAAGAIEAAVTILAIKEGMAPPTGGLVEPDPACGLVHVIERGRSVSMRAALSSSFGFGGTDTVLVFVRPDFAVDRLPVRELPRNVGDIVITSVAAMGALGNHVGPDLTRYLEKEEVPVAPRLAFDPADELDREKARRMDRMARTVTAVASRALAAVGGGSAPRQGEPTQYGANGRGALPDRNRVGLVAGHAFGNVDGSAEFMQRLYDKGPRLASPFAFPSLVPSSASGHAAIYLGLGGPVMSLADLSITGEGAIDLAVELLVGDQADAMLAVGAEQASIIVERVLGPLCTGSANWKGVRSEGAAAVLLESAEHARRRGALPIARLIASIVRRGSVSDRAAVELLSELRPQGRNPLVVLARDDQASLRALAATGYRHVERRVVAARAGHHEATGGLAVAVAAAAIARGHADDVLVVGVGSDRWSGLVLTAP